MDKFKNLYKNIRWHYRMAKLDFIERLFSRMHKETELYIDEHGRSPAEKGLRAVRHLRQAYLREALLLAPTPELPYTETLYTYKDGSVQLVRRPALKGGR